MNLLYISPQFPGNYLNFITRLKREGVTVLGIASDPYESLPDELKWGLTEYYRVDNMHDYAQMLQAGRYFRDRYGRIDRIESHADFWLTFEGALREDLGVAFGKKRDETAIIRHKSLMKPVFKANGVPVARGEVVRTLQGVKQFVESTGYPIILKPDAGVGAAATWRVDDEQDLELIFKEQDLSRYFVEEFIDGPIETFDGLTDHEGRIVYCNSLIYSENIMEVVNNDNHTYYYTPRAIPPDLEQMGSRMVKAFDVREKFFHLEFFRNRKDGRLYGLEANIRPPGGYTVDMWNFADDIDLYAQWARIVAGRQFDAKWSRKYHTVYISRKDNISYARPIEEILARFGNSIVFLERLSPLFRNALGDTGFILRASEMEDLMPVIQAIHAPGNVS